MWGPMFQPPNILVRDPFAAAAAALAVGCALSIQIAHGFVFHKKYVATKHRNN